MQVPNSRLLKCALVIVAGFTVSSVGCRSTRDSLSTLPGMTWLSPADGASMGSLAEQDQRPSLPPPSREATPQVVTSEQPAKPAMGQHQPTEYPDTGYPSLYPKRDRNATTREGYATGQYDTPRSPTERQPAEIDHASVGQTQRGFYDEQYQSSGPERGADYEPGNSGGYTPSDMSGTDTLTGTDSHPVGESRWSDQPAGNDLSASEATDIPPPNSAYDQIRQGVQEDWRNTTQAVSRGATEFTQGAQGMVREAEEAVRQGVSTVGDGLRNGYERFSQGVTQPTSDPSQNPADRFDDYPTGQPAATGADTPSGPDLRATGQSTPATPAEEPTQFGGASGLNAPADAADNRPPSSGGQYSAEPTVSPSRSLEPWRPGSTGDYPQSSPGQSRTLTPTGQRPYVEPASYDGLGTPSPTTAPTGGWSQNQRLAPSYR